MGSSSFEDGIRSGVGDLGCRFLVMGTGDGEEGAVGDGRGGMDARIWFRSEVLFPTI